MGAKLFSKLGLAVGTTFELVVISKSVFSGPDPVVSLVFTLCDQF
jgi:hypothetical protein